MSKKSIDKTWKSVPIGSICEGIFDGPHATPKPSDAGPIFLGINNISECGRLDLSDIRHIAEDEYSDWTKRVVPREGDIVFSYEATLNRYAIIPSEFRGCLGRRLALVRIDKNKSDYKFIFYSFFSKNWRDMINKNIVIGSTVNRIPLNRFPTFKVALPDLVTQRRIASILSAYDDLIENNTRRIKILEEMARSLYREWFGSLRFPGHDSNETRKRPASWKEVVLAEIVNRPITYGVVKPGEEVEGGVKFVRGSDVKCGHIDYSDLRTISLQLSAAYQRTILNGGEIIISLVGNPGESAIAGAQLKGANIARQTGLISVENDELKFFVLYFLMSEVGRRKLQAITKGSVQQVINLCDLQQLSLVIPPPDILRKTAVVLMSLWHQQEILHRKNRVLRQTRDLLLPKLMSGEIDVSSLPDPGA